MKHHENIKRCKQFSRLTSRTETYAEELTTAPQLWDHGSG